tara:strand:+ start:562 stop:1044 length:483 start_codon:yes stop_codon:yes gene_type:complete
MHFKYNNKESKTYVQGLRPFGNTLPRGVKGILKKNGYNYSQIISKWNIILSKNISSYCYPKLIKMNRGNENGLLVLSVERGNEINVEYSKNKIISKINSYFGYKLIGKIKLETFSRANKKNNDKNIILKPSKKFEEKINKIKNKTIRDSLAQLLKVAQND